MNSKRIIFIGIFIFLIAAVFLPQSVYVISEYEQVIVTRLQKYDRTVKDPGLYWKMPFIETVLRFDKRILARDADPGEYLTKDKKRLLADHVVRWKVADPLLFYKTVRSEMGAVLRLDDIVYSEMRRELADNDFASIISEKREELMEKIAARARELSNQYGIDVIDVRIKRADLPKEVQASVFARMVAERERIAKRYRSEGEEEAQKIRAETDKEKVVILAEAYAQAEKVRGEGDQESTRVYAQAYGKDAEFYRFTKSIETYEKTLKNSSTFVMSNDSELLRYFKSTATNN